MKKYLSPVVLAALLASCVANDPSIDGNRPGGAEGEVKGYLSINLVSTGAPRTRDDAGDLTNNQGQYQYGTAEENYVNEVRFYFFYNEGMPCPIRKNPNYVAPEGGNTSDDPLKDQNGNIEYYSYYDWSPTYSENQNGVQGTPGGNLTESEGPGSLNGATIEKVLTAMVVLTSKEDYAPDQVVAVINPTPAIKNMQNPSLAQLKEVVANFHDGLVSSNFVMSNTSQIAVNGENNELGIVIAQDIADDKFQATQPEAQENPLVIYVERVLARLDQSLNIQPNEGSLLTPLKINEGQETEYTIYPTDIYITSQDVDYTEDGSMGDDDERDSFDNMPVYVHFLGWAVTSTPRYSNLLKDITTWDEDLFGAVGEPWYIPQYHRTFWGINPSILTSDPSKPDESYYWYNYNELIGATPVAPGEGEVWTMDDTTAYMQENANKNNGTGEGEDPEEPTKVIYAAELCDSEGNPQTIAEWNGVYFTLTGIKELAASMLQMYYNSGTEADPKYTPISPDQITFITRREYLGENTAIFSEPGSYYVYPALTSNADAPQEDQTMENAASLTWYHHANDGTNNYTEITPATLSSYMYDTFGVSKIWNNGQTYYYCEINHLGEEDYPGYFGVVRNHIYNVKVNKLSGIGTPVWDPNEDIYPERPTPEGNNISAQVKVLMWRMVSQDVEFDW